MNGYQLLCEIFKQGDSSDKVNAPEFAYRCLNKKRASPPIYGREANHPQSMYQGILIDKAIPRSVLDQLHKIEGIELRSSCQGDSDRHLSFIIFRLIDHNINHTKRVVDKIEKKKDYSCCYDIGQQGLPRIVVTSDLWYGKNNSKFTKWWNALPKIIMNAVES